MSPFVDSSSTSPPVETPESPAPRRGRGRWRRRGRGGRRRPDRVPAAHLRRLQGGHHSGPFHLPPLAGLLHRRSDRGRVRPAPDPVGGLPLPAQVRRDPPPVPVPHAHRDPLHRGAHPHRDRPLRRHGDRREQGRRRLPNPDTTIHVYAFQWGWEFEYDNGRQGHRPDHRRPHHGRADRAVRPHLPALLRRAARLLRAGVQLQPLRQPGLLDGFQFNVSTTASTGASAPSCAASTTR